MRVSFEIEGGIALIKSVYCFDALCHDMMMVAWVVNETLREPLDVVSHIITKYIVTYQNCLELNLLGTKINYVTIKLTLWCILNFRSLQADTFIPFKRLTKASRKGRRIDSSINFSNPITFNLTTQFSDIRRKSIFLFCFQKLNCHKS